MGYKYHRRFLPCAFFICLFFNFFNFASWLGVCEYLLVSMCVFFFIWMLDSCRTLQTPTFNIDREQKKDLTTVKIKYIFTQSNKLYWMENYIRNFNYFFAHVNSSKSNLMRNCQIIIRSISFALRCEVQINILIVILSLDMWRSIVFDCSHVFVIGIQFSIREIW